MVVAHTTEEACRASSVTEERERERVREREGRADSVWVFDPDHLYIEFQSTAQIHS